MNITFKENDDEKNSELDVSVEPDTPMKKWMVEHVGTKLSPEDGLVTVEMIVEVIANEFPEFLLAIAEENWVRGYKQGLADMRPDASAKTSASDEVGSD